jgi:glutamate carboxypeptidase
LSITDKGDKIRDMVINEIEKFIENNLSSYLSILKKMVEINSYTLNLPGISSLGEYTGSVFRELGFSARMIQSSFQQYGEHLILEKNGRSEKKIAFISHLDTVYSEEEEKKHNFRWKVEGDRIYGPGTVDIKGGTMMIYILLDLLRNFKPDLYDSADFTILLDCAEEVGGADFGHICREFLPTDKTLACLVFEGCNLKDDTHYKVVSRKGMAAFDIDVTGRSAHSGTAHKKGASAVVQMADIISKINGITDYGANISVNFGKLSGGSLRNRVADKCTVEMELRAEDLDIFNSAVNQIESFNGRGQIKSLSDNWQCVIAVKKEIVTPPWECNKKSDDLFYIWDTAAYRANYIMKEEIRGGLSDGNLLWQEYAVLDGLGPGGDNSHCSQCDPENGKEQEYLTISSITPVSIINLLALHILIEKPLAGSHQ